MDKLKSEIDSIYPSWRLDPYIDRMLRMAGEVCVIWIRSAALYDKYKTDETHKAKTANEEKWKECRKECIELTNLWVNAKPRD